MTVEQFKSKRTLIFIAALIATFCAGFGYSWSILQSAIMQEHADWAPSAIAITYTLQVAVSCLGPIPLSPIITRLSVRGNMIVGGILYGIGIFACSFATSLPMFYIFYGVLSGAGVAFIYPQMMSYSVKVLADKGSLASGFMAAAYGSGAVIWAPVANTLIETKSLTTTFTILGIVFLIAIICMSFILADIPEGYVESFAAPEAKKEEAPKRTVEDKTRGQMIKTATCWIMLVGFSFALTSGMLAISQAKGIVANTGGSLAAQAALCVSVITLFNTLGRLFWGSVSTKTGIYNVMIILCVVAAVCMGALAVVPNGILVVVFLALAASCFGGFATLLTPMTADFFGYKNLTANFGFMYIAFAVAALIGPRLATSLVSVSEAGEYSYSSAYIVGAILSIVGAVCAVLLKNTYNKSK
ncbi:MAG: OFA family MFS transporter [Eubacterium sp.]|nr:OFA family MFS transporter [Eubacterium sp.]